MPNEMRLSCGAELECSQTEFYNTVFQGVYRISLGTGAASFKRVLGCPANETGEHRKALTRRDYLRK